LSLLELRGGLCFIKPSKFEGMPYFHLEQPVIKNEGVNITSYEKKQHHPKDGMNYFQSSFGT